MRSGAVAVLALAWLAAFNLRSGLIGLGPALPDMTADLGLSFSQASFLVAIPTLMMGLMAVPGGGLADRWGPVRVMALGLALVALGGLRAIAPEFASLLLFTFIFGAGIGLSQPSLPRLVRSWFPGRLGVSTGIYASGLIVGSIVAASVTGPYLDRMDDPAAWRALMAVWGVLAGLALVGWSGVLRPWRREERASKGRFAPTTADLDGPAWSPWRDRGAWLSALLFAAQGLVYYLLVAWLPAIYGEAGLDGTTIAALFVVFNAATLPGILFFPSWSDRLHRRRPPTFVAAVCFLIGVVGLLVLPLADPWRWLWPALAGGAVAGLFAMSLVLPADIAPRGRTGAAAGMVLGVGYAGAALGPVMAGVARDVTGSFAVTLLLLPAFGIAMIVLSAIVPELPRLPASD